MVDRAQDDATFNARIVYWGIEGAGKRSSLAQVAHKLRADHRGELREVPTRLDPTVSYPMLPIELGEIGGIRTRIEVIAVPSGPEQAPTRKQLLDRADGVVFVVNAERASIDANLASLEELEKGLQAYARSIHEMPFIVQYNKRDLSDPYVIDELHRRMDVGNATVFESVATDGSGILQALSTISKKVIRNLRDESLSMGLGAAPPAPEPALKAASAPTPLEVAPMDMEAAILAHEEHPAASDIEAEVRSAQALLERPAFGDPSSPQPGARIGADLSIVSVGEATRADDRTVRVPLVLGDGDGETSTVVLSVRLDPLMDSEV